MRLTSVSRLSCQVKVGDNDLAVELPSTRLTTHGRTTDASAALGWTDTLEIAIQLSESHPDVDPAQEVRTADEHGFGAT